MRTEFELITESYLDAKQHDFAQSPTAEFIRTDGSLAVQSALGDLGKGLLVKGSAGQGTWAESPWIAVLDPLVTTTPQRGYYVAYLFSASMKRVVLSFAVGITDFKEGMPLNSAKEALHHIGALIRLRLPEYKNPEFGFDDARIELDAPTSSSLAGFYEAGHAFGLTYPCPLPQESQLVTDLNRMIRLYRLLTFRGGINEDFESDAETISDEPETDVMATGLEDARRYRFHRRIERNTKLATAAKKVHGLVCEACGFTFESLYGELGRGYIEAHHLTPLASLPKDRPVRQNAKTDFAVLCANCHRMIHRKDAPKEVCDFRALLKTSQN